MPDEKEAFIAAEDRSEGGIDPEKMVSDLRVRDLASILGIGGTKILEKFKSDSEKFVKYEKLEKPEKPEKWEKLEKFEKLEKWEQKEPILEPIKIQFERPPIELRGGDPEFGGVLRELIESVTKLQAQVDDLSKRVPATKGR
jgi:hypothetical protein